MISESSEKFVDIQLKTLPDSDGYRFLKIISLTHCTLMLIILMIVILTEAKLKCMSLLYGKQLLICYYHMIFDIDFFIQILQTTIREKDQNIQGQAMLISKLSAKVENYEEEIAEMKEQVEKANHALKLESEKFDMKLRETQKYFEESLQESQGLVASLRENVKVKDDELLMRENDLRELISRHEKDIQRIMAKGEVDLQDHVLKMLEQKLKDTNEVLEGKIKVIEVLQKEVTAKDREIEEGLHVQKNFKEKLQTTSEQLMLMQANIVDMEIQWKDEKKKLDAKIRDLIEKQELERTEKELTVQTMQGQLYQYQTAYTQAVTQYNSLQERFHHSTRPGGAVPAAQVQPVEETKLQAPEQMDATAQVMADLKGKLLEKEKIIKELEHFKSDFEAAHVQLEDLQKKMDSKVEELKKNLKAAEDTSAKNLKQKAQLTAKIKTLEKENGELKVRITED